MNNVECRKLEVLTERFRILQRIAEFPIDQADNASRSVDILKAFMIHSDWVRQRVSELVSPLLHEIREDARQRLEAMTADDAALIGTVVENGSENK